MDERSKDFGAPGPAPPDSDPPALRVVAPAKINLRLEVLGRRGDGFHELSTTMLALELADELELRAGEPGELTLRVSGPAASADVPTDERNLAWAAARAALDASPWSEVGLHLHLIKRVPSRAGLGGGSSDAAAAAFGAAWMAGLPSARFDDLLEPLGSLSSDAPFFLGARATGHAWCTGRGEQVEELNAPLKPWTVVLLVPDFECPTAEVYGRLRLAPGSPLDRGEPVINLLDRSELEARGLLFNGLEIAALRARPELGRWRALLGQLGMPHFRLSGSGSSLFGLYRDAEEAAADLERARAGAKAAGLGLRASLLTRPSRGVREV